MRTDKIFLNGFLWTVLVLFYLLALQSCSSNGSGSVGGGEIAVSSGTFRRHG